MGNSIKDLKSIKACCNNKIRLIMLTAVALLRRTLCQSWDLLFFFLLKWTLSLIKFKTLRMNYFLALRNWTSKLNRRPWLLSVNLSIKKKRKEIYSHLGKLLIVRTELIHGKVAQSLHIHLFESELKQSNVWVF